MAVVVGCSAQVRVDERSLPARLPGDPCVVGVLVELEASVVDYDKVDESFGNPASNVHAHGEIGVLAGMDAGGQHETLTTPFADAVEEGSDISHELGEQGSVLLDFRLSEEGTHVVVDLDAVRAVAVADLLDDGETFLPDLRDREVEAGGPAGVGGVVADHVFRVLLLETGEHVAVHVQTAARSTLVDAEAADNLDILLVCAVDNDLQGIKTVGEGAFKVLGGSPPHDAVVVVGDALAPALSDARVVQEGRAGRQAERQRVYARAENLVDGLLEYVPAQGRVVAVHEVVPRVVVVDQLGFSHGGCSLGYRPRVMETSFRSALPLFEFLHHPSQQFIELLL